MSAAEVDNLNQLIGKHVSVQVENDELKDFQIISDEKFEELSKLTEEKTEN